MRLGRAIEPLMQGDRALALCRHAAAQPLSACLDSVDTPEGRRRVAEFLQTQPFPHYEPAADSPGLLVRIEADGKRVLERFVNRQFKAVKTKYSHRAAPPVLSPVRGGLTWMANRLKKLEIAKAIPRLAAAGDVAPLGLGPRLWGCVTINRSALSGLKGRRVTVSGGDGAGTKREAQGVFPSLGTVTLCL